jgi:hypothetical protein
MSSLAKLGLFMVIGALLLLARPAAAQTESSSTEPKTVTGCLQKGVEPNGFYIAGEGMNWELAGKTDFAAHVGHKVTVTGHVLHRTAAQEAKYSDSEKQEANGTKYADFQVASLKMISDTCQ